MEDMEDIKQIAELIHDVVQLNEHIDILVAENKKLKHNFNKAKQILADIMDFYEIHAVMSEYECRELMKKYME
jgi:regulator of replication initiation timing